MKSKILIFSLVISLLLTASGLNAIPVRAAPTIESIYFTAEELEQLRLLRTAPSHSTIWNNIVSWADAHKDDAPVTQPTTSDSYVWLVTAHEVRQHIETMGFMYAMTENTTYADSAIDWMLSVSSWDRWGIRVFWSKAELLRGFSFGYSVFHDYMTSTERDTIRNTMVLNIDDILVNFLAANGGWFVNYPNNGGTLASCVGLASLAIGADHPDSDSWLNWDCSVGNCCSFT